MNKIQEAIDVLQGDIRELDEIINSDELDYCDDDKLEDFIDFCKNRKEAYTLAIDALRKLEDIGGRK